MNFEPARGYSVQLYGRNFFGKRYLHENSTMKSRTGALGLKRRAIEVLTLRERRQGP